MNGTQLFIENEEIELDESVQFAITKQFEDLTNPTAIINDWSKTVSIPFTEKNNRIFGHIYNPDKVIVSSDDAPINVYFDPTLKLNFALFWNNGVLIRGYAKMNSIVQKNGFGTYNITLSGSLGKIFQEMKKITFDKSYEDYRYIINGENYLNLQLNAENVAEGMSKPQENLQLYDIYDENYHFYDIVGFTPVNSYSDLFDYNKILLKNWKESTEPIVVRELGGDDGYINTFIGYNSFPTGKKFEDYTKVSIDNVLDEGKLKPFEMNQFRSWLQQPFIYFNKLGQMFFDKVEEVTGYDVVLDSKWFNKKNKFWAYNVMMLNTVEDSLQDRKLAESVIEWDGQDMGQEKSTYLIPYYDGQIENLPDNSPYSLKFILKTEEELPDNIELKIASDSQCTITFSESYLDKGGFPYGSTEQATYNQSGSEGYTFPLITKISKNTYTFEIQSYPTFEFFYNNKEDISALGLRLAVQFTGSLTHQFFSYVDSEGVEHKVDAVLLEAQTYTAKAGSNISVTLNDLWNNGYTPFDIILNYCKMFRLGFEIDDAHKKIYINRLVNLFNDNYQVFDYSDRLDKTKDFEISYTKSDKKYIKFNTKDTNRKLEQSYKDTLGYNYGETVIDTLNNFNVETEELFKTKSSFVIPYSLSMYRLDDLLGVDLGTLTDREPKILQFTSSEVFLSDSDENNKHICIFGQLGFATNLVLTQTYPSGIYITDDNDFPGDTTKNCYITDSFENRNNIGVNIENVNVIDNYSSLNFVQDRMLYTYGNLGRIFTKNNFADETISIYTVFFEDYLNDLYNPNTKKITCYLYIKPADFVNYKPYNFIKIENQLYLLNKIYDYNFSDSVVKCELITVNNIDAYIKDKFVIEGIFVDYTTISVYKGEWGIINISGAGKLYIENHQELVDEGFEFTIQEANWETKEYGEEHSFEPGDTCELTLFPIRLKIIAPQTIETGKYDMTLITTGEYLNVAKQIININVTE